jgi:hypothetical protein
VTLPDSILKKLIAGGKTQDPDTILKWIREAEDTLAKVMDNRKASHAIDIQAKALRDDLARIRKECKHYVSTFNQDPSGNNDSCDVCDICGAEI